jgi:hypothetical protein
MKDVVYKAQVMLGKRRATLNLGVDIISTSCANDRQNRIYKHAAVCSKGSKACQDVSDPFTAACIIQTVTLAGHALLMQAQHRTPSVWRKSNKACVPLCSRIFRHAPRVCTYAVIALSE